jgi:hypothetical protein
VNSRTSPDSELDEYVRIEVIPDGQHLVESMFRHRYRQAAPDFPHHVVAFCRSISGQWLPAAYMHATDSGDFLLGGGACVDDRVLRELSTESRKAIAQAGGLYLHSLRWAMAYFSPHYAAIFGYCGDRLAERIDLSAGFIHTVYPNLLVYFTRELTDAEKNRLIEDANKIGPF